MTLASRTRLPTIARTVACVIAALAFAPQAIAQDTPGAAPAATGEMADDATGAEDANQVYATVDGMPITATDLAVAAQDYAEQLGGKPVDVPIPELLNVVIDMRLLAKAAEDAGLDDTDAVKRRLAFDRMLTLRNAFLRDGASKAVTDEKVQARYDKEIADFKPDDELHLYHILVETEDEGKAIIAEIAAGGDFAAIAKEKSKDPGSGANGGDLDFIPRGMTVPEFEKAAFALDVGEMTEEPVKSPFGWHVIKLEEKRKSSPPELATEQNRIRNEMLREFVTSELASLRAAAKIEIVPPSAPAAGGDAEAAPAETPAQ